MKRLMEKIVFSGFVTACRLATWPTRRSPVFAKATTDGVNRLPSGLVMTTGSPPSMTATTELVVPRSMPMILLMSFGVLVERVYDEHIMLYECHVVNMLPPPVPHPLPNRLSDNGLRVYSEGRAASTAHTA